ncbi:hypothetical protein Pyn_32845 [Prunus yedoensis var. nudiflora]|uniref:Uncharacterized protein n=1 Tax=Prunus yedoensis var. nudiflora TaxID=2094558 RepID=A0A314XQN0_PRUYE|nr:hypothetical protein Pyn_32845 [Prunus yedoensis var. nudiflora]
MGNSNVLAWQVWSYMRKQGCLYKIFPAAMLRTATRIALYAFIALALRSSVTAAKRASLFLQLLLLQTMMPTSYHGHELSSNFRGT